MSTARRQDGRTPGRKKASNALTMYYGAPRAFLPNEVDHSGSGHAYTVYPRLKGLGCRRLRPEEPVVLDEIPGW